MHDTRHTLRSADLLKRLMRDSGVTVNDLVAETGMSRSKVAKLLSGSRPTVTSAYAERIAHLVDVEHSVLFSPRLSPTQDRDFEGGRSMTPEERTLRASVAAHISHAKNPDGRARTAAAKTAAEERFVREARDMHPDASDEQIARVARQLQQAYMARLSLKAATARRKAAEARRIAAEQEAA